MIEEFSLEGEKFSAPVRGGKYFAANEQIARYCAELPVREWAVENLWIAKALFVALLLAVFYFLLKKFLSRMKKLFQARRMQGKSSLDPIFLEMMGKIFTMIGVFIALLIALQILGLSIAPLITFGGIGAAALGIASKDVVSNLFGGMMLYATRPFTVGDLIEIPEKNMMGTVEAIGWYHTSIRDLQKKPIYAPNAAFSTTHLINWSRITHRRIDETLAIRPEDAEKVPSIVKAIRSFLEKSSQIDHPQGIHVFFQSYQHYSLEIVIQAYVLSVRYDEFMELKQNLLLEIKEILDRAGAELAKLSAKIEIQKGSI